MDIEEGHPVSGRRETVSAEIRVISDYKRRLFGYDGCDHRREVVPRHLQDFQVVGDIFEPKGHNGRKWSTNGQAGDWYETRASPTLAHV